MNKEAKSSKLSTIRCGRTVMQLPSYEMYKELKSLGCTVGWLGRGGVVNCRTNLDVLTAGTPQADWDYCTYYVLIDSDNSHNDD